jgi:hypothetical protein
MKECPYCGKTYSDDHSVCPVDNTPLRSPGQGEPPTNWSRGKTKALAIFIVAILVLVGLFFLPNYKASLTYRRFITRDPDYYRQFAAACDLLIQRNQTEGSNSAIPHMIQDIQPSKVIVSSTNVFIPVFLGNFAIFWSQNYEHTNDWTLAIIKNGQFKRLYATTKS